MKNYMLLFVFFFAAQALHAQSDNAQAQVTDEELEKYAVTMDSINDMKESLLEDITDMVKSNEKLTNARYNELSKIVDDEAALAEAKATPEEIAFMKEVGNKKEEGTAKIQETFQSMAKDYVGASSYNKVKKALEADGEVKKRYETFMDKLEGDSEGSVN
jgi:hypothetical protein